MIKASVADIRRLSPGAKISGEPPCAGCGHAEARHQRLSGVCQEPACECGFYVFPERTSAAYRRWSNAQPTDVLGIRFPSKMERRVYERLLADADRDGYTIYRQVSLALLCIKPRKDGVPFRFTPDFCLVYRDGHKRWVEAKGKRRSRDYALRRAAAEQSWDIVIEEVSS